MLVFVFIRVECVCIECNFEIDEMYTGEIPLIAFT